MTKYINPLIFFCLLSLVFLFEFQKNISVQITSILPNGENKELIAEFEKLNQHKQLYLFHKNDTPQSLSTLQEIEQKLLRIKGIKHLSKSKQQKEFDKQYFYLLNKIDKQKLQELNIKKELQKIHSQILSSAFSFGLDLKDPFSLYTKPIKGLRYTKLDKLGYITILSLDKDINNIQEYARIYNEVKKIEKEYSDLQTFSVIYYYIENANKIKNDTNTIIYLALGVLFLLYLVILRDIKLLFHTFISLGSSILFALILSSLLFEQISIFALIFAISISTVAIDYMFHNYMHGYYKEKRFFNRDVFFGMCTTVGAFFILSMSNFTLISQITLFAIFSLLFSYLQFTFLFPNLRLNPPETILTLRFFNLNISKTYIMLFSILLIIISLSKLQLDTNIKTLDVDNTKLQSLHQFFETHLLQDKKTAVLIKGKSVEELIDNAYLLDQKYPATIGAILSIPSKLSLHNKNTILNDPTFIELNQKLNLKATQLGFRKEFFQQSYNIQNITLPNYDLITLQSFPIKKYKEYYISYLIVSNNDYQEILKDSNIHSLSFKELFEDELKSSLSELTILGGVTFIFIVLMIYFAVKEHFLKALNFILFPIGIALCLTFFYPLNILHVFMIIVLISIGIDYGIYMNSKSLDTQTYKAIIYSLFSTFAGFGVLIFSSINALFSIGITALLGIISLLILLLIQKGSR